MICRANDQLPEAFEARGRDRSVLVGRMVLRLVRTAAGAWYRPAASCDRANLARTRRLAAIRHHQIGRATEVVVVNGGGASAGRRGAA